MLSELYLKRLRLYRYQLPLNRPLLVRGRSASLRQGLVIELEDQDGYLAYGEIAPLPGLHTENLQDCSQLLRAWADRLRHRFLGINQDLCWSDGQEVIAGISLPAVCWGLETALISLWSQRLKIQPYVFIRRWLGQTSIPEVDEILINALLGGGPESILADALKLLEQGFSSFKLKVASLPLEPEIELVKRLGSELGRADLRLDANRCWTLAQALSFGRAIQGVRIEYLEEPTANRAEFEHLYQQTQLPLALDESLPELIRTHSLDGFCRIQEPMIAAYILKPTLYCGIKRLLPILALKAPKIISSTFESGLGIQMLAQLAAAISEPGLAMGLDTYRWLQADILSQPLQLHTGRLDLSQAWASSQLLQPDRLQSLEL